MSAQPDSFFTLEEYFALEQVSERRFEYRDGEVVCMSGGTIRHNIIADNTLHYLHNRLSGKKCRPFGADMAIYVPAGQPYRYADVTVVCGPLQYREIGGRQVLENAILIVEVLSKSTANYDRGTKFEEYKSIPSLQECLLIDQSRTHVAHRTKMDDGGWIEYVYQALEDVVPLEALHIEIPLSEIYEDLDWAPEPGVR